jgi:guanylate cyclase
MGGLRALREALTRRGNLTAASESERILRANFVFACMVFAPVALFWGVLITLLGKPAAGAIPGGYGFITAVMLAVYASTGLFEILRASQLGLVMILPGLLQLSLGGFAPLLYLGPRASGGWLLGWIVAMLGVAIADPADAHSLNRLLMAMNFAGFGVLVFLLVRYAILGRDDAQHRAEGLLLNVLPRAIADRLRREEGPIADHHADTTVLFADIVEFTPLSSSMAPGRLVRLLDEVFSRFDDLADQYGMEKIKTIGDAYMAVAGLPTARADHAEAAARMALAMRDVVTTFLGPTGVPLRLRLGLHSGPVVAGIIGRRKFLYDLWGDTVNTASRMESQGEPDSIQVSDATAALLQGHFELQERGLVNVKGKGLLRVWRLLGARLALESASV